MSSVGMTVTEEELRALNTVLEMLDRRSDPSVVMRTTEFRNVRAKLLRAQQRASAPVSEVARKKAGDA